MANQDPAITKAKALLSAGAQREAFNVLGARIVELNAELSALTPRRAVRSGIAIQEAITIFTGAGWQLVSRDSRSVKLQKRYGVDWLAGSLLTLFLGIIGGMIVSFSRSRSKAEIITLETDSAGVRVLSRQHDFVTSDSEQLSRVARSIKGGIPPVWTLALSMVSYPFWLAIYLLLVV